MPTPRENETREEFITRCMSDEEAMTDFPEQDQRFAFCQSEWERSVDNRKEEDDKYKDYAVLSLAEQIRLFNEINRSLEADVA